MAECDRLIQKLIDYLTILDTDSACSWEVFLSMLRTNKENILKSSVDEHLELSDYLTYQLLKVGCADKNTVKKILAICCDERFNFRNEPMSHVKLMNSAFGIGDDSLMAVLVKYGLVDRALKESEVEYERAESEIVLFRSHAVRKGWLSINNKEEFIIILNDIMEDMRRSCFQRNVLQRGVRRILLLAKLLGIFPIECHGKVFLERHFKCFKLFFTAHSDPFISLDELLTFLQIIFNRRMTLEGQKIIAEKYKSFFTFEASLPYQPRTLKDLCRCSIRQVYGKRCETLPVLVKRMCIPETLKDFILGDWEDED